jgi:hypothetical protein
MLKRHAARWATYARTVKAHLDNAVPHAHHFDIAAICLDIRPKQVHDLADLREQGVVWRRSWLPCRHRVECTKAGSA